MVLIGGKPDRVVECIKIILDLISEVMFIKLNFILSLACMNARDHVVGTLHLPVSILSSVPPTSQATNCWTITTS